MDIERKKERNKERKKEIKKERKKERETGRERERERERQRETHHCKGTLLITDISIGTSSGTTDSVGLGADRMCSYVYTHASLYTYVCMCILFCCDFLHPHKIRRKTEHFITPFQNPSSPTNDKALIPALYFDDPT